MLLSRLNYNKSDPLIEIGIYIVIVLKQKKKKIIFNSVNKTLLNIINQKKNIIFYKMICLFVFIYYY